MEFIQTIFSNAWLVIFGIFLLGVTIFVHELGHFLAARRRGMKVERFSIGFGPKICGWTGADGVEYRISWIPLGGYVSLPQLADMAMIEGESKSDVEKLPPISFSTKVIVAAAGPLFNMVFAVLLACVVWIVGQQIAVESQSNVIGSVRATIEDSDGKNVPGPAAAAGIKAGDSILAVDGRSVSTFSEIWGKIVRGAGRGSNGEAKVVLTIKRGGEVFDVNVFPAYVSSERFREIGVSLVSKVIVSEIVPNTPAAASDLRAGDLLVRIDETPIQNPAAIGEYLARSKDNPVVISYLRDGQPGKVTITPRLVVQQENKNQVYQVGIRQTTEYTLATVHIAPWKIIGEVLQDTWENLSTLVNPRSDIGLNKMSGPIGIVAAISVTVKRGPVSVILFMILINIGLAVFNLLPIPVLDGGHILFAIITKLKGGPLPARFIVTTQSVFMLLLFSMMIYVSFFDVRRVIRDNFSSKPAPAQQAPAK